MRASFLILFLIAPFACRLQAKEESLKPKGAAQGEFKRIGPALPQSAKKSATTSQTQSWAFTLEKEPGVTMALTQALGALRSARKESRALVAGSVHIKFMKLPKDHFALVDPYYPSEIQVNRQNFEQTMKELGDIGYFNEEALRLAAFLWAPSLAHEISHSLNFGELIKLTGLEPPPYVLEEEIHGHISRAGAVADVLKGRVSEGIMWQTTIGQFNLYRLQDFSRGSAYLRDSVVALYQDLSSVLESDPDSAQTLAQHKFLMAAGMAEARGTPVAEEERQTAENQYKFWSDPELIEKVKEFYKAQMASEKKFFKTGK